MRSQTPRTRSRAPYQLIGGVPAMTAVLIGAAACGSATAPGAASSSSPAAPKVSLSITVTKETGETPRHWTLQCDPAGGTAPDAAAVCRGLMTMKDPFATPPPHQICPMILASSGRATVTGTWFGATVNRTIVDGGCDLSRWHMLGQIVN
ncbi:MAG: SSI family serine proteinase inhibitor [Streptosporangiaceae bacterium]|jgi:hypothetical protein